VNERNPALYRFYLPLANSFFHAPVFFLYFSERFDVERVVWLSAIYYAAVVALELPSGWFSDRVSRVVTLRVASAAKVASYALFLLAGSSFTLFVVAELLLAAAFAFQSGTDTSFHHDALSAVGREDEYAAREAHVSRDSFLAQMASAAGGGLLGVFDLGLAYAAGLAASLGALGTALALREPPRGGVEAELLLPQVTRAARYLRDPLLAWLFAYVVLMTTLEHVPFVFAQPYLAAVLGEPVSASRWTPLAAGAVMACYSAVGALAAARSVRLGARFGLGATLLGATAVQTLLISAMAAVVHPLVALLLIFRSAPRGISGPLVNAAVAPRVSRAHRATYLSLHSLAGRGGYSLVLWGLGALAPAGASADPETIALMLRACAVIAVAGLLALALGRRAWREPGV
jgi:hypothetical protein